MNWSPSCPSYLPNVALSRVARIMPAEPVMKACDLVLSVILLGKADTAESENGSGITIPTTDRLTQSKNTRAKLKLTTRTMQLNSCPATSRPGLLSLPAKIGRILRESVTAVEASQPAAQ